MDFIGLAKLISDEDCSCCLSSSSSQFSQSMKKSGSSWSITAFDCNAPSRPARVLLLVLSIY